MNPALVARLLASTAALAVSIYAPPVGAQSPQAPTVAAGSIAVTRQGATTIVTQGTAKGIIDWRSFSIGPQETVRFDQPGRSSVTLNRVTSSEVSRIDGNLVANGQVWLSNPNGVMVGPGGQVNVGGLLATTGRIDATEFLRSGRASIDQIGKDAAIVNSGAITVGEGGYAALAAAAIRNDGVIAARSGTVALGSGKAMTVDFAGDKLITYQVTQPLDQAPAGGDAAVVNGGTIAAQGGSVLLTARAAKGVMDSVINLKGQVVSNSVRVDGGTVIFGDSGAVKVSGKIDVSNQMGDGGAVALSGPTVTLDPTATIAADGNGRGGQVRILATADGTLEGAPVGRVSVSGATTATSGSGLGGAIDILGQDILLAAATLNASGATGGGVIRVGGDWQGSGALGHARTVLSTGAATLSASATVKGDGGKVVVWSDLSTTFYSQINAVGAGGGFGGKVEVSSKGDLTYAGTARAASLLLDPHNILIDASGGGGPLAFATTPGADAGISAASLASTLSGGTSITLQANNDITVNSAINVTGVANGALTLQAGRSILLNAPITMTTGDLTLIANERTSNGVVDANRDPGAAAITAAVGANISTGSGNLTVRINDGAGLSYSTNGDIALQNVATNALTLQNLGAVAGTTTIGGSISIASASQISSTNGAIVIAGTVTYVGALAGSLSVIAGKDTGVDSLGEIGSSTQPLDVTLTANVLGGGGAIRIFNGKISTAGGSISLVGGAGGASDAIGSVYSNFEGILINSSKLDAGAGAILARGRGSPQSGVQGRGVNIYQSTLIGEGGVTIEGAGAVNGGNYSYGVNVQNSFINPGTPTAGAVSITGERGAGANARNVLIDNSTIQAFGAISIVGTVSTLGGSVGSTGVETAGASSLIKSLSGSITIQGTGASTSGTLAHGVYLSGGTVTAPNGGISITGVRGGGGVSSNISISGSTVSTVGGNITIDASSTALGSANQNYGLAQFQSLITTTSGTIAITANGAATGGSSNEGFNQNLGTISLAGSGVLKINATGGSVLDLGYHPTDALISANTGVVTILTDSAIIGGTSSFTAASSGTISFAPASTSTSIGLNGAAGGLQASLANFSGAGSLIIGRSDLTGQITVGAGVLGINTTLLTGGGDVSVTGAIEAASLGSRSLTVNASSGTMTIGGSIGSSTALASLDVTAGLVTNTASTSFYVKTAGAQSWNAPVALIGDGSGSFSNFSATNADIKFTSTINSLGGAQILYLYADAGTVSLGGSVGATTPMNYVFYTGSGAGKLITNGNIFSIRSQGYTGSVMAQSATTFNANGWPMTFDGNLDGPGAIGVDTVQSNASATFTGNIGANTPLASFNRNGGPTVFGNAVSLVKSNGAQVYSNGSGSTNAIVLNSPNTTFSTTDSPVTFYGPIDSASTLSYAGMTIAAGTGLVSFLDNFGHSTPLASFTSAGTGTVTLGGYHQTEGLQSYGGGIILTGSPTFGTNNSDLRFSGPMNAATAGFQTFAAIVGTGTVSLVGGVGTTSALGSLSIGKAVLAGTITTSGAQTYGGPTRLSADAILTTGGNAISFAAIDGPGGLELNPGGGSVSLLGAIGATTTLNMLKITNTGSNVTLPTTTAGALAITTSNGTVVGSGALTISGTATFNTGSGQILLGGYANDFNTLGLVTTTTASIQDGTGGLLIDSAQASNLTLNVTGAVTQNNPITANSLVVGGGGNFTLNAANVIGNLSGSDAGSVTLSNSATPGLTVGNLSGSSITLTQSGAGNYINVAGLLATAGLATLSASGNLDVNGTLSASSANLSAGGTISGLGTITVTSAPMTISANGGAINPIVSGVSGPAVATSAYVNVISGSISVNGSTLSTSTATVATTPSVASMPTVATVPTVATIASVPTVVTVATVASAPTVTTVATIASVASVVTTISVASTASIPSTPGLPVGDTRPIASVILPPVVIPETNFDLAPNAGSVGSTSSGEDQAKKGGSGSVAATIKPTASDANQNSPQQSLSAQSVRDVVASTPTGALIPPSPPIVASTGAPLISTPTVKVDAADTGGVIGGQVVSASPSAGGGSGKVVVPGLVSEGKPVPKGSASGLPPLAQQPSQMNEEPLLD